MKALFPTWVSVHEDGPVHLNEPLVQLTHSLMKSDDNASVRTNAGGWHYAFDLFELKDPVVDELRAHMEARVQEFIDHFRREGQKGRDEFRLAGWINVNRQGDWNVLHCHPGCFLSATYYVQVPDDMAGGEIVFRDPRGPAVAMYETPAIDLPWVGTGTGIPLAPATGTLILFPSWLEHRVEPFVGVGERISIAFNASRT